MKKHIFMDALISLIIVAEWMNYLEGTESFVIETFNSLLDPKYDAETFFKEIAEKQMPMNDIYADMFRGFNLEEDFRIFAENQANVETAKERIRLVIESALLHSPNEYSNIFDA